MLDSLLGDDGVLSGGLRGGSPSWVGAFIVSGGDGDKGHYLEKPELQAWHELSRRRERNESICAVLWPIVLGGHVSRRQTAITCSSQRISLLALDTHH